MYEYVTEKQVAPYRAFCQSVLDRLREKLKREYGTAAHVTLVGSGAANMVTRNGNGPFDLDYNLVFTSIPKEAFHSAGELKDTVRTMLDSLVSRKLSDEKAFSYGREFTHGQDSTSSITYLLHSHGKTRVEFRFDVALILEKGGSYSRLIHDKKNGRFLWNLLPKSKGLKEKLDAIKSARRQEDVREIYLQKKNGYLSRQDRSHPSYIIYVEAVHQAYQKL